MLLLLAWGCKAVDPAPAELDDLFHWMWTEYDTGEDADLAGGLVNLDAAVDGGAFEDEFDGTISRLSKDEARAVGVLDRDPSLAAGLFMVNTFTCDLPQLEEILSYDQQDELYEDVYDSYTRAFVDSREGWLDGDLARLDFSTDYGASILGASYTTHLLGAIRRVDRIDQESTPFGPFLVQRSVMPEPSTFEEGSGKSMDQDYQLEIYWPRGKHRIDHAYAMWRQADWGGGFDTDGEATQRILLNNLVAWDGTTEQLCADGRP